MDRPALRASSTEGSAINTVKWRCDMQLYSQIQVASDGWTALEGSSELHARLESVSLADSRYHEIQSSCRSGTGHSKKNKMTSRIS